MSFNYKDRTSTISPYRTSFAVGGSGIQSGFVPGMTFGTIATNFPIIIPYQALVRHLWQSKIWKHEFEYSGTFSQTNGNTAPGNAYTTLTGDFSVVGEQTFKVTGGLNGSSPSADNPEPFQRATNDRFFPNLTPNNDLSGTFTLNQSVTARFLKAGPDAEGTGSYSGTPPFEMANLTFDYMETIYEDGDIDNLYPLIRFGAFVRLIPASLPTYNIVWDDGVTTTAGVGTTGQNQKAGVERLPTQFEGVIVANASDLSDFQTGVGGTRLLGVTILNIPILSGFSRVFVDEYN
jgi:hypothetical protein